jgi:hypothetical protein
MPDFQIRGDNPDAVRWYLMNMQLPLERPEYREHAQKLGEISGSWAFIEHQLALTLGLLIRRKYYGDKIYFSLANTKARLDIIRSLVANMIMPDDFRQQFAKMFSSLKHIAERRNNLVHCDWTLREGKIGILVVRPAAKSKSYFDPVSVDQLIEFHQSIRRVLCLIVEINGRLDRQQQQQPKSDQSGPQNPLPDFPMVLRTQAPTNP